MTETLIAYHCAPALAGIKPANIVACQKSRMPNVHNDIKKLNTQLNCRGIYLEIICECEKRALVMVYRKEVLEKHIQKSTNKAFLVKYGYPKFGNIEKFIECLKTRIVHDAFPHEIGVFLGYPLRDIYSFINNRGNGYILTGEWKVYHNAEEAQRLFSRYKACRMALAKKITNGNTLAQIFCAA